MNSKVNIVDFKEKVCILSVTADEAKATGLLLQIIRMLTESTCKIVFPMLELIT